MNLFESIKNNQNDDIIKIKLYGETHTFTSLMDALNYIREAIAYCDPNSSECQRYYSIYQQLKSGSTNCSDEINESKLDQVYEPEPIPENLKVENCVVEHTGGGIMVAYGKLANGEYFSIGDDVYLFDEDIYNYEYDEENIKKSDGDFYDWEMTHGIGVYEYGTPEYNTILKQCIAIDKNALYVASGDLREKLEKELDLEKAYNEIDKLYQEGEEELKGARVYAKSLKRMIEDLDRQIEKANEQEGQRLIDKRATLMDKLTNIESAYGDSLNESDNFSDMVMELHGYVEADPKRIAQDLKQAINSKGIDEYLKSKAAMSDEEVADFKARYGLNESELTPEEKTDYELDEDGIDENLDKWIHCDFCEEIVPISECKKELNMGWICKDCQNSLYSHGEHPVYDDNATYYEAEDNKRKPIKYEIEYATPNYTGGSIYVYTGKLKDGNYFIADDGWMEDDYRAFSIRIVNADPDNVDDPNQDDIAMFPEWQEEHLVKDLEGKEAKQFTKQILEWIINNKPKGNYQVGDMQDILDYANGKSDVMYQG